MPYSWYFTWISWKRDRSINFYGHSKSISWISYETRTNSLASLRWTSSAHFLILSSQNFLPEWSKRSFAGKDISQANFLFWGIFTFGSWTFSFNLRGSKVHLSFSIDNLMEVHLTHNSKVYWLMIYNGNNNSHLSLSGHGIIFHKNGGGGGVSSKLKNAFHEVSI